MYSEYEMFLADKKYLSQIAMPLSEWTAASRMMEKVIILFHVMQGHLGDRI